MEQFHKELKELIFSVLVIDNKKSYDKHVAPKIERLINKHLKAILNT